MHKVKIFTKAINVELGDIVSISYSLDDVDVTSHPVNEIDFLNS